MNVQNTEAWNVFIERSEQGVSAVPASLALLNVGCRISAAHCLRTAVPFMLLSTAAAMLGPEHTTPFFESDLFA